MKPYIHALSSAKKFGGIPEDYEEIHTFMDSSKGSFPDNRHRILTHQSWFIMNVLERVKFSNSCEPTKDNRFPTIKNSEGSTVSIRDIGEQHILEDFNNRFIPSVQDYFESFFWQDWFENGKRGTPSSHKNLKGKKEEKEKIEYHYVSPTLPPFPIYDSNPFPDLGKVKNTCKK